MSKFEDVKNRVIAQVNKTADWACEHPVLAGITLGAVIDITKIIFKESRYLTDYHREKVLKERMVYDRSLGIYLKTNRPMTNTEKVILSKRHNNGESVTAILSEMNLL